MSTSTWLQNATKNLLSLSKSDVFTEALQEWEYSGLIDNEDADFTCQLCNHPEIRYEYSIRNKNNHHLMIIGSSCILKFIDKLSETDNNLFDSAGNVVYKTTLENDKQTYWKTILFDALDTKFSYNDFQKSITSQIKLDGKLTINQAKHLKNFYSTLTANQQSAFRSIISIKLMKKAQKHQYTTLTPEEKSFVDQLLTSQQKKIINS